MTKRSFRWLWIVLACVVASAPVFYAIIFSIYWPFTKQDVIDTLQERSLRTVTIGQFRRTYFPPGCIAEQIRFLRFRHKDQPPLITIRKLTISNTYPMLFTFQHRIGTVRVDGLHLTVPAKEPAGEPSPVMPLTYSNSKDSMPIDNLYADGAILEFYRKSNPTPLHIKVYKLAVHNIGPHTALAYNVRLYNSEPPGIVVSQGAFGPWNPKDTGSVPVHGTFHYDDANLAFFKELSGTLFGQGRFGGNLARINVNGAANVRDFTVRDTGHKRGLAVNYQVGVNATNGDIDLTNIAAAFDRTDLSVTGSITGTRGNPDKNLSLEVVTRRARIEDLMNLVISDNQPPMTGNLAAHLHAHISANRDSFLRAMTVTGGFGLVRGRFTDKRTEQGLTRLSESAENKKPGKGENPVTVLSDLKGRFTISDGMAHLSHVEFEVPGAHASLDGDYSLMDYGTKMHGLLITKGNVSATETGVKSFLLKVMNPLFKRWHQQKVVPFKVTGRYGHTNISLDLDRKRQLERSGIATGK
ncbi:MAG: AsmA-like C-terminal region-containing protein [Bryobacteraceae bacterium]